MGIAEGEMKLIELEPEFVTNASPRSHMSMDSRVLTPDAQGILFLCPYCFKRNAGPIGTHSILVFFKDRGVPAECEPLPRWNVQGNSFDDLTISPSIDLGPDDWHGFVTNGEIVGGI